MTAEADAAHPSDDPTLSPPGVPKRPKRSSASTAGAGSHAGPAPTPVRAANLDPPTPTDRIDLFDYDEYSLTDEDRWWLSRLDPTSTDDPRARGDDSRFPTEKVRQHPADITLDGFTQPPLLGDLCACGGLLPPRRPQGVHVHVKLTTLLGWYDHPALIPGLGPVVADVARLIAADVAARPVWRWSIVDAQGEISHHGYTRSRPTTMDRRSALPRFEAGKAPDDHELSPSWCRCVRHEAEPQRSVVDLHLTMATLRDLAAHPDRAPGYEAVIADIARQVEADVDHAVERLPRGDGRFARFPNPSEAAFIRARDRSCRAPHCRKRAASCEIDHRVEHAKGGSSDRGNCHCLCKRHHGIRHRKGFAVTKRGRLTTWTTRNRRAYDVGPEKDVRLTDD